MRDPITHELKVWPIQFRAVLSGKKTFEFRKDDRDYQVGDILRLRKWWPSTVGEGSYATERRWPLESRQVVTHYVVVTHLTRGPQFGIPDGYVIMSIREVV